MCCTSQQVTHHLSLLLVSVACCCIFKWCHQYPIFLAQNAHHFYIVPEPPLTIRFGHQRGTTSLTIALPFGSMLAPRRLGPWISLMFVAVLSFSFWEPEQGLYMIVFKVWMAQFNLPWLAWVNIGGRQNLEPSTIDTGNTTWQIGFIGGHHLYHPGSPFLSFGVLLIKFHISSSNILCISAMIGHVWPPASFQQPGSLHLRWMWNRCIYILKNPFPLII